MFVVIVVMNRQNGFGKCPACNSWNSFYEEKVVTNKSNNNIRKSEKAEVLKLNEVESSVYNRYTTNIMELDRVLRRWTCSRLSCTTWW